MKKKVRVQLKGQEYIDVDCSGFTEEQFENLFNDVGTFLQADATYIDKHVNDFILIGNTYFQTSEISFISFN